MRRIEVIKGIRKIKNIKRVVRGGIAAPIVTVKARIPITQMNRERMSWPM